MPCEYRLRAPLATGLMGMQENHFLSTFFDCMAFKPITTQRYQRDPDATPNNTPTKQFDRSRGVSYQSSLLEKRPQKYVPLEYSHPSANSTKKGYLSQRCFPPVIPIQFQSLSLFSAELFSSNALKRSGTEQKCTQKWLPLSTHALHVAIVIGSCREKYNHQCKGFLKNQCSLS